MLFILKKIRLYLLISGTFIFIAACKNNSDETAAFTLLTSDSTKVIFKNKLTPTPAFNMFKYMYFYNGAGVGAGDLNNDGLIDLYFAANQTTDKVFLNQGNLKFTDITAAAGIQPDGGWSTGVSIVDINNDGLLDIYVCRVGNFETLKGKNRLLICDGISPKGIPHYSDKAAEYGLDFSGFSTQAAFFDYDLDGDLDLFLLNHSVHQNGTFAARSTFTNTFNPLSGDRFYRNDSGHYTDVTKTTGIYSTAIGYGLGIAVADINLDGYPDVYIGNDFHENDYMYINQHDGTFKEEINDHTMHTSQFSMGVDVADINNDAYPEIISMDMLPSDPYILKRSLGEDEYNIFNMKINYGYNHQYARNNLQYNRKNGMFSETALYSGVYATDWSWAPLWMDFDNDGYKDLFISNGIPKRLNDMDYVNYVSNEEIQDKIKNNRMQDKDMSLIDKFPEIKLPNVFYHNSGNLRFAEMKNIANNLPTFSNGSAYADLDNDGDLDIVVNNVDEDAMIYRNNLSTNTPYLKVKLNGPEKNKNAIGSRLIVYTKNETRTYEKYPAKGFLSSMEEPLLIGLDSTKTDSILLIWPDNSYQKINTTNLRSQVTFSYTKNLPFFYFKKLTEKNINVTKPIEDITAASRLQYLHTENPFNEFDREPLIPCMVSREGPALSVGDMNADGKDDLFIGSSKGYKSAIFLQDNNGHFQKSLQPAIDNDSTYEDADACWVDVNNDGHMDLLVASGGNEYYGNSEFLTSRLYINDGRNHLLKQDAGFSNLYMNASCIKFYDFTGDGYPDLFIGGRSVPWEYGQVPQSYLLENDKKGHFKIVNAERCADISMIGFVKSAEWVDIDHDKDKDLLVTLEWGGIYAFINNSGYFTKKIITDKKGWWNFTLPVDVDNDGDLDFICGNEGLNARLHASLKEPLRLYYNDFDGNGKNEQILTYYLQGKEIPFANKDELQRQIPVIKKRFLYAGDFAKADLEEIFTKEKLSSAQVLTTDYLSSAVLINDGKLNFTVNALPFEAQLSPMKSAVVIDANNDQLPDILMVGNFYDNNIQMSRNDADYGTILLNKGNGKFECSTLNGMILKGQIRNINPLQINKRTSYVLGYNNDSTRIISFRK